MGLIHKHASDEWVETVLELGLSAAVVGAGVVDVNGLSVPPPAPSTPDFVAAVSLEVELKPVIRTLEETTTLEAKVPLIIPGVGRAPDEAAAAWFVQKPRTSALLTATAKAVLEASAH